MITVTLIAALAVSSIWILYIAFFNSRVQGFIITWILRHTGYVKDAEIRFGSISMSLIGGKIMFRELKYISKDYAIRCVDGALIFKWFTRLSPDDISRESQTWSLYHIIFQSRALLTLHGLEVHIYNRTSLYDDIERIEKSEIDVGVPEEGAEDENVTQLPPTEDGEKKDKFGLRNLIPVLVVEVQKGKFVVGNKLTETVMFIDLDTATAIYSTPTKKHLDPYMHMLRSKISKIRITLNKSPCYTGLQETPPSQPEAGVPLLRSREVRLQYVQDVPGRVTNLKKSAESSPEWEMTIKFMKETVIHYGPWLDRQRDILYQFFYPPDYKVAEVSKPLRVGDLRRHQYFNIIIDFEAKSTFTILFYRNEQTSSINIDIENGSRIQMQIPWTVTPQGFTTQGVADLYKVQCQTSLDYRPFFEADEVHMIFHFQYPRVWHHMQTWGCDFFNVNRPLLHFVFDHVDFITDLINDWSPAVQPDLIKFVPYVWNFNFKFNDALIILPVSQHNWVDCMQSKIESSETVFFGLHCEIMDVAFTLPFTNFQPVTTELRFDINAEEITGSLWLPQYHTLKDGLKQFNMGKIPPWLPGQRDKVPEEPSSSLKNENVSPHDLTGWEECWSLQDLFLRFTFLSNSVVPYERPGYKSNLTNEEKTNHLGIEVMIGPSVIRLHGLFFKHLWFFKDNYFGYDDKCTPLTYLYNRSYDKSTRVRRPAAECPLYDLDITCKVIVKDILGEFPRHCDSNDAQIKLPCAQIDMIEFELFKTKHEGKMELTVSPITFLFGDYCKRAVRDLHISNGFLQLQGVKVDMCGLYSGVGLNNPKNPFDFLEYGFLVEVTTGPLVGKMTVPHIQQLVYWLEIFVWQCMDRENEMPITEHQMGIERVHSSSHKFDSGSSSTAIKEYQDYRLKAGLQKHITTDDLKYLMIKVSIAHTDVYVVESGCACNIATKSVRIALCNAHDETSTLGVTVVVQGANVTQYVRLPSEEDKYEADTRSQWLQAGVLSLPPLMCDINKRLANPSQYKVEQRAFLKVHDRINQRLLFLWLPDEYKGCGCVGGVTFNNTSLVEVNGFYFEPVIVPSNFCQCTQSSNTPWRMARGMSQTDSHTSPGSSISSRLSDRRKNVSDMLMKEGFGGLSPRPHSESKSKKPPSGKKKISKVESDGFTTFPPRSKKRDKQKTLSHYNDLLRNFSIKRNISRLSSKRKSKCSETMGSEHSDPLNAKASDKSSVKADNPDEVEADGKDPGSGERSVNSSSPSICVTTETPAVAPAASTESLDNTSGPYESPSEDLHGRRASKYTLPPQSPGEDGSSKHRSSRPDSGHSGRRSGDGRRRNSKSVTLSRSSSQDSFHSARSGWKTADGASSAGEDKDGGASTDPEEEPVKGLSIPFPFPAAADSALNHELIDIYRHHLPKVSLVETRFSNTVVLNKSYNDITDSVKIPHRISSFQSKRGSDKENREKVAPVAPSIHQMLQLVKYILPVFEAETTGSSSSVTSENLFSNDPSLDSKSDPKLMELRRRWEKKLKEKKVSDESEVVESECDGKILCMAEIIEPVDLFFTPFCVHAINKYVEIAEVFYRDLHPAAVVNLVHAASAPTVLEIAIQHATAQKALLFSNHLQPIGMKKFDNSLERTIDERLNLELFLFIPAVSVRTLQGGGDLQWVGTETELESARSKAHVPKDGACTTTDDEAMTDRSESAKSDASVPSGSADGSSNVICPSKIAKLSLIKFVANNIDVSFCYHQFEKQKPISSPRSKRNCSLEGVPPGEYTQTAFRASVDGIFGQLHILHPLLSYQSDTFIPYSKTRVVMAHHIAEESQKFSNKQTSVVFEFGAEHASFSGAALKRNLLVGLPLPPEQIKPKHGRREEDKQEIHSFAMDGDSVDIELGKETTSSAGNAVTPFKYKKLVTKASIHYHSGPDKLSNSSYIDDAQEPLISDKGEDGLSSEKLSVGAEVAASMSSRGSPPAEYRDKSCVNGKVTEFWLQMATPSVEQTDLQPFNPYSSLPHAVLSWSVPGSLLVQFIQQLAHTKLARVQSVIAALLAEALGQESQYEPPSYTTKYSRITIAAKTLKESAVIRLMNQLRYTLDEGKDRDPLYHDLTQDAVPRRIILERGVQAMLAAIEGNLLQTSDNFFDTISSYPSTNSHAPTPGAHHQNKSLEVPVSDKTPVYYLGKQDYGSIAALDRISIGKPPQVLQSEAKHRTHRQALMELLSSSDKAKLADKYFALYKALDLRLPKTDHVNHQLMLSIEKTSISAIDCHRDIKTEGHVTPFFKANDINIETSLFPAFKEFSIPKVPKEETHRRSESRSSVASRPPLQRHDSSGSISRRSSHSVSSAPIRPPRKKKSKKVLDVPVHSIQKSIRHVVKHLVINFQCGSCSSEINVDLLRLSKAVVDGMSNFQPSSFQPVIGDSTQLSGSGPCSPSGDVPRSADEQFVLSGCWEKMNEYVQLMFRGDHGQLTFTVEDGKRTKPRLDRDIMLYTESPDIPLSVTATWRFDRTEIMGRLQGLTALKTINGTSGTAAILQNLYVEMNNSPNNDIILEPLSPNVICGIVDNSQIAVSFADDSTEEEIELICLDIPRMSAVYSFLPHVTRIQKLFVEVSELKAKIPKPIVKIQNILMDSVSLILHEIKNFDRYFQRPLQSLQRIHIESNQRPSDLDFDLVIKQTSLDLELLPSLSLKHEVQDFHLRLAQSKGLSGQIAIYHHELSLVAPELHTHLPLPQIFIKGEKVKKKDPGGMRSGIHGEHYTGIVEIKTFQIQLPTTMLNHVIFVQNAFMKEINEFLEAISVIRTKVETTTNPLYRGVPSHSLQNPHGVLFAFTMRLQGIDLLATTPTGLAVSLKTETINVEIKNKMVTDHIPVYKDRQQIIERPRMFISTTITTDITLGTLADISPGDPSSLEEEMVKFLQFRATASLGNDEGLFENKLSSSESFHATISNPQLFMQPGAFDKALLFYINYKGAYEIFNDERQALNKEVLSATETFMSKINFPKAPPALPTTTQLKMTVKNLAVCLPIQNQGTGITFGGELLSASQTELPKYAHTAAGALSISIRTADMKMSFGAAHVNVGSFNDFVVRFIDDFDEKRWMENAAPRSSEKEMNSIAVDTGNYNYVTNTETAKPTIKETNSVETPGSGKMFVNVGSFIKGVNIHLNTAIISRLVALYKTLTSLVDDFSTDDGVIEKGDASINEVDGVSMRATESARPALDSNITAIAKKMKSNDKQIDDESKRVLERFFKETDDDIKALKKSGAPAAEIQLKEEQADNVKKLLVKAYMQGTPVNKGTLERTGSGKRRKTKTNDEITMLSTITSKSRIKEEGSTSASISSISSQQISLDPPSLEFEMDLDIRLGYGKISLYPLTKPDDSFRQNRRFARYENQDFVTDNTEFLIPETTCKLHYSSTKITEKSTSAPPSTAGASTTSRISSETTATSGSDDSAKAIKTGSLYTSIKILSLKQDQIIRPCLLEYLDQLLSGGKDITYPNEAGHLPHFIPEEIEEIFKDPIIRRNVDETKQSPTPNSEQSSSSRQTKDDTFPVDIIIVVMVEPSTIKLSCQPYSRHECSLIVPRSSFVISTKGTPSQTVLVAATGRKDIQITRDGTVSCWNCAGSLEECKLSLYHPLSQQQHYPQGRNLPAEVRNALSVTINGVGLAITRITTPKEVATLDGTSTATSGHGPKQLVAHVSSMTDIGKIALTYDIKRMDEIDAFHNAWLNGSFIKRLLLLSRPVNQEPTPPSTPSPPPLSALHLPIGHRSERFYSIAERPSPDTFYSLQRGMKTIKEDSPDVPPEEQVKEKGKTSPSVTTKSSETASTEIAETTLFLAINAKVITLTTNLGHTLGRINISLHDAKNTTTLCLKERHNEKREVEIFINRILLESTAGLITGIISFWNIAGTFEHSISPDCSPRHIICLNCGVFENRIDYLSNCIHMIRVVDFRTDLYDEWRKEDGDCDLRIGGQIGWETVQTMVNSNTAPNMIQIKEHLDDFIQNQKKYSQRAYMRIFSQPPNQAEEQKDRNTIPLKAYEIEAQKIAHHWFWAVSAHSTFESIKILLQSGQFVKPLKLGGSLKLSGKLFSVALFQGEKFRDDTWSLITLNETTMSYDTTVEEIMRGTQTNRVTKQQAVICMGNFDALNLNAPNNNIGCVEKCVRSTKLSPPERTDSIAMWLRYACTHDFAHGNPNKDRPTRATIFGGGSVEYSTIFQLPEMKLNLTTEHNWDGEAQGSPTSVRSGHHLPIPVVHCRLKSQFKGSIGLATNAAHYFFLHDLAQRYTKKMEKYLETAATEAAAYNKMQTDSGGDLSRETPTPLHRQFVCEEWELKPQLRLHGGGKVEFQVDWLLNKLGFKNPTVTIPKWIQRGPMDPLDFFVSGLVQSLVFQQAEIVQEVKGKKTS